jgi:hypothetical protein
MSFLNLWYGMNPYNAIIFQRGIFAEEKSGQCRTDQVILRPINTKTTSIILNRLTKHELEIFASKTGGQFAPA